MSVCESESTQVSKQVSYGDHASDLDDVIESEYLPTSFKSYNHIFLACYDIESLEKPKLEQRSTFTFVEAKLNVLSIGVSTNLPLSDKFFVRKSSDGQAAIEMVQDFVNYLDHVQEVLESQIPNEIHDAIAIIESDIEKSRFGITSTNETNVDQFFCSPSIWLQ